MEILSLRARRHRQHNDGHNYYSPRLPTPEESSCGSRSFDDEPLSEKTRSMGDDAFARSTHRQETVQSDTSMRSPYLREGGNSRSRPNSPPYLPQDMQKPSLPPLKTILANTISSPPRSPAYMCSSAIQPSPQEPAYTAATYKPPSLYPHKKQRIDYQLEPVAPFTQQETYTSPVFRAGPLEYGVSRAPVGSSTNHAEVPPRTRYTEVRRSSIQPAYRNDMSPELGNGVPQLLYIREPIAASDGKRDYRPFQNVSSRTSCAPESQPSPPHPGAVYASSTRNTHDTRCEPAWSRRDSMQGSYEATPIQHNFRHENRPIHQLDERGQYADTVTDGGYDPGPYPRRLDLLPPDTRSPEMAYTMYQNKPPSFFMPSQYDYRHGRARKRSNLPKQSTEIMKTWFDQNISNPYPSEEQKAMFSNATGISMTQVSNWFINHRRRCPELRDKRSRGREWEA